MYCRKATVPRNRRERMWLSTYPDRTQAQSTEPIDEENFWVGLSGEDE
jgi:hypothetical protein